MINCFSCDLSSLSQELEKQTSTEEQTYQMLNKSFNHLTSTKLKELDAICNWKIIDLSHNSIEFIDAPELFEKQNELEVLQIDFNAKFNSNKNETILIHKKLKRVSFKGCGFTEIYNQHFAKIEKLTDLNLSSNKIIRIDAEAFRMNDYLRILDLSENKILKLSPLTFSTLKQFQELILSFNPIELNLREPFLKSKSIKRLIMNHCNITKIYKETFAELKKIEVINLNENRIKTIEVTSFVLNPELKSLFIENNNLKCFPASILDYSKELEELCADNNTFVVNKEFHDFTKKYTLHNLRTINCSSNVKYFIENQLNPELEDNEIFVHHSNSTDQKSSKLIKFHKGISNFFIGSYLTIILMVQAAAFILLTLYLIKIIKYEKLGKGININYANTISNNDEIYKVYKLNE